jgi:hypothetical protein
MGEIEDARAYYELSSENEGGGADELFYSFDLAIAQVGWVEDPDCEAVPSSLPTIDSSRVGQT